MGRVKGGGCERRAWGLSWVVCEGGGGSEGRRGMRGGP